MGSAYKYDKPVKLSEAPPFPSAPEYDAKAWKIIQENIDRSKTNLFWNVAAMIKRLDVVDDLFDDEHMKALNDAYLFIIVDILSSVQDMIVKIVQYFFIAIDI